MKLEDIQERLRAVTTADLRRIAGMCGVSYGTLLKLRYSHKIDPKLSTVEKLREFFRLAA